MGVKARSPKQKLLEQAAFADFSTPAGRKAIFDWYNSNGLIPKQRGGRKYKSIEHFLEAVEKAYQREVKINPDFKPKQALNVALSTLGAETKMGKGMGVEEALSARNRVLQAGGVDYSGFPIDVSPSGKIRIGARSYGDELLSRPQEAYLRGKGMTQQQINDYKKWGATSRKVASEQNQQLRALTGIEWDRGHFIANKYGGALTALGSSAEAAAINRGHGELSRGNTDAILEAGYSRHRIEDVYAYNLNKAGFEVQGQRYLTPADIENILQGKTPPEQILDFRYKQGQLGNVPEISEGLVTAFMPEEGTTKIKPAGVPLEEFPQSSPELPQRAPEIPKTQPAPGTGGRPQTFMQLVRKNGAVVLEKALTTVAGSALSPSSKMMDVAAEVAGTMLPEEIKQNPMVQQTLGIMSAPLPAQAKAALTVLQPTPLASGELKDNQ